MCGQASETIGFLEHEDAKWLAPEEIDSVKWLPSDLEVIAALKRRVSSAT